jgi:hypothetical protein
MEALPRTGGGDGPVGPVDAAQFAADPVHALLTELWPVQRQMPGEPGAGRDSRLTILYIAVDPPQIGRGVPKSPGRLVTLNHR